MDVVQRRIQELHLFSSNETLEELSTKDLLYMTVPFIAAELEHSAISVRHADRLAQLLKAQVSANMFYSIN